LLDQWHKENSEGASAGDERKSVAWEREQFHSKRKGKKKLIFKRETRRKLTVTEMMHAEGGWFKRTEGREGLERPG